MLKMVTFLKNMKFCCHSPQKAISKVALSFYTLFYGFSRASDRIFDDRSWNFAWIFHLDTNRGQSRIFFLISKFLPLFQKMLKMGLSARNGVNQEFLVLQYFDFTSTYNQC